MSDENTMGTVQATEGTEVVKLYTTRDEAQAAKPADASKNIRPFEVLHNGTSRGWVLARGHASAIEQVARMDGYSATTGWLVWSGRGGSSRGTMPVTKEAVASKLAEFTDDELAALGLSRKKGAKK